MGLSSMDIKVRENRSDIAVANYGNTLWHYTDFNALDGIINKKEIWFGSAANMNDKEELSGFLSELKREVLADITKENISKANSVFSEIENRLILEYPFIFCLSRARNDAAQWERYANCGKGVSIVFNTKLLCKLIFYNHFIMNEEYYGYKAKKHKMKTLLIQYIQDNIIDGFSNLTGLIDNLLLCAMVHKHESFAAEQEVRLAPYFVKDNNPHLQYKIGSTIKRVYVVDLADLCKKENIDFADLIDAIVVGPNSQQNIEDLRWYCKQIGLSQLASKISKSDCPLRE